MSLADGPVLGTSVALILGIAIGFLGSQLARGSAAGAGGKQAEAGGAAAVAGPEEEPDMKDEELKMVLLVRTDLKMGKGKIAAQCCHAAVGAYEQGLRTHRAWVRRWADGASSKIALKAPDEQTLHAAEAHARRRNLPRYLVADAGRTQVAPGSLTVLAIGPAPKPLVDTITGRDGVMPLKLLS